MPPTPNQWAGGVAHDPRDRSTWISNGLLIAKVNPRTGCTVTCAPFTAPNLAIGQVVTGLAYNENTNRLFVSHSDNRILTYSVAGCALTLVNQCTVTVPTNHVISGLATDDANGRIWYVSDPWLGPNFFFPWSLFSAAPQSNPCAPTCGPMQINDCAISPTQPMSHVTGLAFDTCGPGAGTLYAMSSSGINAIQVVGCVTTQIGCCQGPIPGLFLTGLCVLPVDEFQSFGPGCSAGAPTCFPLHTMTGDSTIGNPTFSLDLSGARGAAIAVLFWNVGLPVPSLSLGFCANVLPNFPWFGTPGVTTGAINTCLGTYTAPTPIPNNPGLCGLQISTQYAGFTFPNLAHNFVSNALTWTISGS